MMVTVILSLFNTILEMTPVTLLLILVTSVWLLLARTLRSRSWIC